MVVGVGWSLVVVLGPVRSMVVVVGTGCSVMVVKIARWTVVVVAGDDGRWWSSWVLNGW